MKLTNYPVVYKAILKRLFATKTTVHGPLNHKPNPYN